MKLLNSNSWKKPFQNKSGVALLIAMFSLSLLLFIAVEVSYDTQVEYISSSHQINKLKANYAAKAGVELSLLRILIYKKAIAQYGEIIKKAGGISMLDPIWNFPFMWPPVLPDEASGVDKSQLQDSIKESLMDGQFLITIQSEGAKIDINDMASPSKELSTAVRTQLLQIFQNEIENNDKFADKYSGTDFEVLLNNIVDWVDEDSESLNGGDEQSVYPKIGSEFLPPNAAFKTEQEILMVEGMNDDFYSLLKPRITIFGIKGININQASEAVLKSLDPQLTRNEDALKAIIERRNNPDLGGPFKSDDDFNEFLGQHINVSEFNKAKIPLYFDAEYNFRIEATGQFANSTSSISAVTYDMDGLQGKYVTMLDDRDNPKKEEEQKPDSGPDDPNKKDPPKKDNKDKKTEIKVPKGRPTIVYWNES